MRITVQVAPTTIITNWNCAFCGERFGGEAALADIFDEAGEHLGVACPTCLEAGTRRVLTRISPASPLRAPALDLTMPSAEVYRNEVRFGEFLLKHGSSYPTQKEARRAFQQAARRVSILELFVTATAASPCLSQRLAS
ncbi:MAG: hypothetical protein H0T73_20410 [Ardenticatenales bacterium]|nr:hypothetical protein [Ardenticatenales bacterium]